MLPRLTPVIGTLTVALFNSTSLYALPKTPAECERLYPPSSGPGKDVVWVPTPDEIVNQMLTMAKVTDKDYVIDLGSGDGKIVIAAARDFGARGLGIEYDLDMVKLANCMLTVENVTDKARIRQGDIFKVDFSKADVVTMYLLPQLNLCLRHRILSMKPGTRIASHNFTMEDWEYDNYVNDPPNNAYLWIVPARVAGDWKFTDSDNKFRFSVSLNQIFQKIDGEVTFNDSQQALMNPSLKGDNIRFSFKDNKDIVHTLNGVVQDGKITGALISGLIKKQTVTGTLEKALPAGEWANMADECTHFYNP
jgi:hypothetical protein